MNRPMVLVVEDERSFVEALQIGLAREGFDVAVAVDGVEALEQFEAQQPDVCFLDVQMPGLSGVEAARYIGSRAHLVFVTAFDQYAVQAFEHGALDYLVKPVEPARLAATVARLQERLLTAQSAPDNESLIEQLAALLRRDAVPASLQWICASVGQAVRMISVDEIEFLRSDEKYTRIAWSGGELNPGGALIRTPLKELLAQLDPAQFVQVHRGVVVNLRAISHVTRGENETAQIHLKSRGEVLPVSRNYLHLFRQM